MYEQNTAECSLENSGAKPHGFGQEAQLYFVGLPHKLQDQHQVHTFPNGIRIRNIDAYGITCSKLTRSRRELARRKDLKQHRVEVLL